MNFFQLNNILTSQFQNIFLYIIVFPIHIDDRIQARLYGASLVCANISRCLKELSYQYGLQLDNSVPVNHHSNGNRKIVKYPDFFIYCWRGGQRSNSLATILSEVGWPGNIYTLVGGYRSWRRLLLRQLDAWPRWSVLSPFWVISGLTGKFLH